MSLFKFVKKIVAKNDGKGNDSKGLKPLVKKNKISQRNFILVSNPDFSHSF